MCRFSPSLASKARRSMPMAMTVIIALATAFVLSLTFVPAMVAIAVTGRVQEKENLLVRGLKALYQPALARAIRSPLPVIAGCGPAVRRRSRCCSCGLVRSSRRPSMRRTSSWRSSGFRARRFRSRRPCSWPTRRWLAVFHRSPSSSRVPALPTSPPIRCRRARPTRTSS